MPQQPRLGLTLPEEHVVGLVPWEVTSARTVSLVESTAILLPILNRTRLIVPATPATVAAAQAALVPHLETHIRRIASAMMSAAGSITPLAVPGKSQQFVSSLQVLTRSK